jgi:hypothetical protein
MSLVIHPISQSSLDLSPIWTIAVKGEVASCKSIKFFSTWEQSMSGFHSSRFCQYCARFLFNNYR